jgi:GDP-L-fucose synthase
LKADGYSDIITREREELNLTRQDEVEAFFGDELPEYIFLAAAKVGGIHANNTFRAEFIYQNLVIETNIVNAAWRNGARRLVFLGSSCIYPRDCPQPMKEDYLLTGPLEITNEPYAIAKIAGIKLCEAYNDQYGCDYVSVMPTNLYGPGDNFDLQTSHVIPALMRKIYEAKQGAAGSVEIWGTGKPYREFLHVDDMADACIFMMQQSGVKGLYNIGSGEEITIADLARSIARVVGYDGDLVFDPSMPDGTPRKLLDTSRLTSLGWTSRIDLHDGLKSTYEWYTRQPQ